MATITEDYVSFETAKLLKEKGFKEITQGYINADQEIYMCPFQQGVYELSDKQYPYPTLQMAMKWLRIEHNIYIEPHIVRTKRSYGYMPNYIDLKELKSHFPFDEFDFNNADKYVCITHDKACEAAIKYCLENLI